MEGPRSRSAVREARAADGSRSVISRKELARQLRRQAYQKAKAQRAEDPKHLAMKETAKARRRELYQQIKERRKAGEAEEKAGRSAQRAEERAAKRTSFAKQIESALQSGGSGNGVAVPMPSSGAEGATEHTSERGGGELEDEVRAALGNKRVNALLQRLRLVTSEPGVAANQVYLEPV